MVDPYAVDTAPDPDSIVQDGDPHEGREPVPMRPIPVALHGDPIVRVRELPTVLGAWSRYDLLVNAAALPVLGRDPRRKRAVLMAVNTAGTPSSVILGGTQAEASSDRGFLMSVTANSNVTPVQIEITHTSEVWASALTANITLSVLNEQWADG